MQLTRWNYSKEEWQHFLHWKTRRKGILFFFFHRMRPVKRQQVPEIRIMADRVWINDVHQPFQNSYRQFREINIREAGRVNILEISYEQSNRICDIRVPIPKGKLREAFEVRERLLMDNGSVG